MKNWKTAFTQNFFRQSWSLKKNIIRAFLIIWKIPPPISEKPNVKEKTCGKRLRLKKKHP